MITSAPCAATSFDARFMSSDLVSIDAPLTPEAVARIRAHKIKQVSIEKGATQDIFDDKSLFAKLETVSLNCDDEANCYMMKSLSQHYPKIRELSLTQSQPLSAQALAELKSFQRLSFLSLNADIYDGKLLLKDIPEGLQDLRLESPNATSWKFPVMQNLRTLKIWNAPISAEFLTSLRAPQLNDLTFGDGVDPRSYQALKRFGKLRHLFIMKDHVDGPNYALLRSLKLKQLVCHHD